MSESLLQAFQQVVLAPEVWGIILFSAFYGVFMGAIPGLTATMAVALFVPMTYWLWPARGYRRWSSVSRETRSRPSLSAFF